MTIQWLASKRAEGLDAEKDTIPVNSLENGYSFTALDTPVEYIWNGVDTWVPIGGGAPVGAVGGWVEVGRNTLLSPSSTITVSGIPDKRYYMILTNILDRNGFSTNNFQRLGNSTPDAGNNYARRQSINGGTDTTVSTDTDWAEAPLTGNSFTFDINYIANLSNNEKLGIQYFVGQGVTGAATAPYRLEATPKWANTSNVMNVFEVNTDHAETMNTGSEVVVLGWDPADTHTDNFWEELASVELGSAGDTINSGAILAKKYLWVQAWVTATSTTDIDLDFQFNGDTVGNYADRRSSSGGVDSVGTSQTEIDLSAALGGAETPKSFLSAFIVNNSANEKLVISHTANAELAGAANAPTRDEVVGKWANTVDPITSIQLVNAKTGSYDAGSFMKVWGHD